MGLKENYLMSPISKSKNSFKLSPYKPQSGKRSQKSPTKIGNVDEIFIDLNLTNSVVAKEIILEKSPLNKRIAGSSLL
jgi:hypothetical protein